MVLKSAATNAAYCLTVDFLLPELTAHIVEFSVVRGDINAFTCCLRCMNAIEVIAVQPRTKFRLIWQWLLHVL